MRTRAMLSSVGLSVLLAVGVLAPASATGGPPTITALAPNPVPADGTLIVTGTGCAANSPVSFRVFPTAGGPQPLQLDSTTTGWTANSTGAFSRGIALESRYGAGVELGVAASCRPTLDDSSRSDPLADRSYVQVALPNPVVHISAPAHAPYASRPTVTVTTSNASGSLRVQLDGTEIYADLTGYYPHTIQLPASLAVRAHTLHAVFDPTAGGSPTVTDDATIVIDKAGSALSLARVGTKKVHAGKKVRLTLALTSAGPRTGTIVVTDGAKKRLTVVLAAADAGKKTVLVKLPKKGARKLTARFLGNGSVKPATSRKVTVRVVR